MYILECRLKEYQKVMKLVNGRNTKNGVYKRARAIALCMYQKESLNEISRKVQLSRRHIYKWIKRFNDYGIEGLKDTRGRKLRLVR